jgi:hypothetical protein
MSAAFAKACDTGDAVAVRHFLAQGADPNYVDQGYPVLASSAQFGHTEVIRALVEAGATVDRPRQDGATPLLAASQMGHVAAVEALLGGGAAVDRPMPDGATPLFIASQEGHTDVVRRLLVAGADRACAWQVQTSLETAQHYGHAGVVALLRNPPAGPAPVHAPQPATHPTATTTQLAQAFPGVQPEVISTVLAACGGDAAQAHAALQQMAPPAPAPAPADLGATPEPELALEPEPAAAAEEGEPPPLDAWLAQIGMSRYSAQIKGYGYDQLKTLLVATEDDIAEMTEDADTRMKKPHRRLFLAEWRVLKGAAGGAALPGAASPGAGAPTGQVAVEERRRDEVRRRLEQARQREKVAQFSGACATDEATAWKCLMATDFDLELAVSQHLARQETQQREMVAKFTQQRFSDESTARRCLEQAGWDLEQAMSLYLPPVPDSPMAGRSFAKSKFKLEYGKATVPKGQMQLGVSLGQLLQGYCDKEGIPYEEDEGEHYFEALQAEAMSNAGEPIDVVAQRMWTSALQLRGKEFCYVLNDAIRQDTDLARPVAKVSRAINQLCVTAGREGAVAVHPPGFVCYRGAGFCDTFRSFFVAGREYRQPAYLATSFSRDVAIRFLRRSTMAAKVLWLIHIDPELMCVHVNLVKKSNVPGEEEYLFAPCESPVVLCPRLDDNRSSVS